MDTVFLAQALVCYAIASGAFFINRASPSRRAARAGNFALAGGAILHAFYLAARGIQAGNIPVASFGQSLSFLAWITELAGLVMIVRFRLDVIGAFVAPVVTAAPTSRLVTTRHGRREHPDSLR